MVTSMIETNKIEGFNIYGVQMVEYTSDGVKGRDFGSATALATLAMAAAVEKETAAFVEALLKVRQKKLSDLGTALSYISSFIANLPTKDPESDDDIHWFADNSDSSKRHYFSWGHAMDDILKTYGLTSPMKSVTDRLPMGKSVTTEYVRRDDLENARANVQYAMDTEENDLQQDLITAQGLVGKRDNSFSAAGKILKKIASTDQVMTSSIGV